MKLSHSKVFKTDILPIKDFAAQSGNISSSAVYYAINNGLIDYIVLGDRSFVAMTKLTRQYKPNDSPNRKKPVKKKKKKSK